MNAQSYYFKAGRVLRANLQKQKIGNLPASLSELFSKPRFRGGGHLAKKAAFCGGGTDGGLGRSGKSAHCFTG